MCKMRYNWFTITIVITSDYIRLTAGADCSVVLTAVHFELACTVTPTHLAVVLGTTAVITGVWRGRWGCGEGEGGRSKKT